MLYDVDKLKDKAGNAKKANKKLFQQLKQRRPRDLDAVVHRLHDEVFNELDCLACANCCKTISPIVIQSDIDRLSKRLKMKSADFIDTYLQMDDEGDYVFKSQPCPMLGDDNYCSVYTDRPRACREYPHTDRKRFHQILPLTLKNTFVCPAVFEVVERLKQEIR